MNLNDLFRNIILPVLVFRDDESRTIVYENNGAALRLGSESEELSSQPPAPAIGVALESHLKLEGTGFEDFCLLLSESESVMNFRTTLLLGTGGSMAVTLYANRLEIDGLTHVILIIYPTKYEFMPHSYAQALAMTLDSVYKADTTDEAIKNALAFAGDYMKVSRSYIFESISDTMTSNTYEWCAEGIEPQMDALAELPKDIYSYETLLERGFTITEDVRSMSAEDRAILEPQGIKSIAIVPILGGGEAMGYVGFDDCVEHRMWSPSEIQYLQSLSDVIASLLKRRNSERNFSYSFDILKTVTDNSDSLILVSDINTDKILFSNSAFAMSVGETSDSLLGKFASVVMQEWASNCNEHDPLSVLIGPDGQTKNSCHVWELHNQTNSRWYQMRDSIIKWIDGSEVHLHTAIDITGQKEYEQQLKDVASTDHMTGLYNREWATGLLQQILDNASGHESNSLVFIDIDRLKFTNDTLGHAAGDRLIHKTVEIITSHIRRSDTLCRWGGDEFVLIVRADEAQTARVMEKMVSIADEYNLTSGEKFLVSFSYGIVGIRPNSGESVDSIISEADKKMYEHKSKTAPK